MRQLHVDCRVRITVKVQLFVLYNPTMDTKSCWLEHQERLIISIHLLHGKKTLLEGRSICGSGAVVGGRVGGRWMSCRDALPIISSLHPFISPSFLRPQNTTVSPKYYDWWQQEVVRDGTRCRGVHFCDCTSYLWVVAVCFPFKYPVQRSHSCLLVFGETKKQQLSCFTPTIRLFDAHDFRTSDININIILMQIKYTVIVLTNNAKSFCGSWFLIICQ